MAGHLSGTKPLYETVLTDHQQDIEEKMLLCM